MSSGGVLARFPTAEQLLVAVRSLDAEGWKDWETFSPHPIPTLQGQRDTRLISRAALIGGLFGLVSAIVMQVIPTSILYPVNVGGKPLLSLPAFFPIVFECTVLFAVIGSFLAMLVTARLPHWHRSMFNVEEFRKVSRDAYFVIVYCENRQEASRLLVKLGGEHIIFLPKFTE
jgi:hypothetical protein